MRRRRGRPDGGVSLFPFLAVLVCTMGALILLLVMLVQQAQVQASTSLAELDEHAASRADEAARRHEEQERERQRLTAELDQARSDREELEWRAEVLQQQRAEQSATLGKSRAELGHLEQHIRQLEAQARALEEEARRIDAPDERPEVEGPRRQAEALRQEAERLREQAEQEGEQLANKPKSYAVVPYDGPNGTHRRPIYIECRDDAIVVQPEGVVLTPADFKGPLGPGNPLDACVRAVRSHWQQVGLLPAGTEPYPLLLVRPNGVSTYAVARAALNSWDDEFGYELVGADMNLKYPWQADPALAQVLQQALRDARDRQVKMAAAMPRMYGAGKTTSMGPMIASPSGGFVRADGGGSGSGKSLRDDIDNVLGRGQFADPAARGAGIASGAGGVGAGGAGTGGLGAGGADAGSFSEGMGDGRSGTPLSREAIAAGPGGGLPGTGTSAGAGFTGAQGAGGAAGRMSLSPGPGGGAYPGGGANGADQSGASGSYAGAADGFAGSSAAGVAGAGQQGGGAGNYNAVGGGPAGAGSSGPTGGMAGGMSSGGAPSGGAPSGGGSQGVAMGSMQGAASSFAGASTDLSGQPAGATSGGGGGDTSSSGGAAGFSTTFGAKPQGAGSLADRRGADWALGRKPPGATAFRRPVRVLCLTDRLIVMSETRSRERSRIVMTPGSMSLHADEFVGQVREHIREWGVAPSGGYWRPELKVEVASGADSRFAELERTLQNSGYEVQRVTR